MHDHLQRLDDQQRADLAGSSPERGSGEAPSRLSTPYRRSKPVAIASEVNAVDITASASTPGVSTSTAGWSRSRSSASGAGDAADQHEHRDHDGEQQLLAVAQQQPRLHPRLGERPWRRSGAAPGIGA